MRTKLATLCMVVMILCFISACRNSWHRDAAQSGLLKPSPGAELLSSAADKPQPQPTPDPKADEPKKPKKSYSGLRRPECPGDIEVFKLVDPDNPDEPKILLDEKDWDRLAKHITDLHVYAHQLEQLLGVEPPEHDHEHEPDEGPEPPKPSPKKQTGEVY